MSILLALALGIGLATAAGLRVFVPVFGAGLAAHLGYIELSPGFAWMGDVPALVAFGTATLLEVVAYYVPWLDHALDAIASPTAVVAGVVTSAAVITDLPPALKWGVAIIGGGGAAGLMQALTVGARIKSTMTTGGLANPILATVETIGAAGLVVLAILLPVLTLVAILASAWVLYRWIGRLTWRRASASPQASRRPPTE